MNQGLNCLDYVVLLGTIVLIVAYGIWKTRNSRTVDAYLMGNRQAQWWAICLSIMATQASAITFLSTPGQAFGDGLRFIQFYLGLPLAMVVLSITAVPLYNRLKVYTAYQFLEERFDLPTRSLASGLFLLQRGLSTGITICAPSLVLSAMLGWNLNATIIFIGTAVILYTVVGGNRAVSVTHQQQMLVIFLGMAAAGYMVVHLLPAEMDLGRATRLAGHLGKMNAIDTSFDLKSRYNLWSGLIGGFFLQLSYFGTDQSQVARYLGGETVTQSRMGLLINGIVKIPMQLGILFIGVLVYVFYLYHQPPVFFNRVAEQRVMASAQAPQYQQVSQQYGQLMQQKTQWIHSLDAALEQGQPTAPISQQLTKIDEEAKALRGQAKELIIAAGASAEVKDTDYVFITFIMNYLPHGLIGLLLAVMFSAAMSSTSAALTSLGGTTVVDIYQRLVAPNADSKQLLLASRGFTVLWGVIAMGFALLAGLRENLIEAVNILGSLFYGCILGIFLVGFYFKYVKGKAVFAAALVAECIVIYCYNYIDSISYLWYNLIGCVWVVLLGHLFQAFIFGPKSKNPAAS